MRAEGSISRKMTRTHPGCFYFLFFNSVRKMWILTLSPFPFCPQTVHTFSDTSTTQSKEHVTHSSHLPRDQWLIKWSPETKNWLPVAWNRLRDTCLYLPLSPALAVYVPLRSSSPFPCSFFPLQDGKTEHFMKLFLKEILENIRIKMHATDFFISIFQVWITDIGSSPCWNSRTGVTDL